MELHERVRHLRKNVLKYSQSKFAQELGSTRDEINNLELGRLKNPSSKEPLLKLMCSKYSVSEDWLIYGNGECEALPLTEQANYVAELLGEEEKPLYDLIKAIMKTYSELDDASKEIIKSFAKDLIKNTESRG